ncbi:MAG: oligosaccharide flippase family protein [Bacteroidales bacterium]|nr:oligosaccharide flippase family protein [Bacteroidales bacterium]
MSELNNKIVKATKWSSITEVVAKLITPITSIVLARLLTPEAFGVVATLTMVITFAEIFTDAGFQKYLILTGQTEDPIIARATILKHGQLTDRYMFLKNYAVL